MARALSFERSIAEDKKKEGGRREIGEVRIKRTKDWNRL
jgi:hypothetical protein